MRYVLTPSLLLLTGLVVGCTGMGQVRPILPPSPILTGISDHPADPQGICLDEASLIDLQLYMRQLREGYE